MASSSRRAAGYLSRTTTAILGFMMLRLAASLPQRGSAFLAIATPSALQKRRGSSASSFPQIPLSIGTQSSRLHTTASTTTSALQMVRNRGGLERRREGATPTEGGMTLYVKAGPDGTSLGDCPFAHFVRMVLEAKGLEYELVPSTQETKPSWLIEHYDGKMPALRHRKECYTESDTIASYLDFFFPQPELVAPNDEAAQAAVAGLFPAMAQYLKHTPDGDEVDAEKRGNLEACLRRLEEYLGSTTKQGPYLTGDGSTLRLNDCQLAPILYHLMTGIAAFKGGEKAIDFAKDFPAVKAYADHMFATPEFQKTVYPAATVEWGWENARRRV